MFRMLNKRGQNTAEYAILIGVIVAAAIAMQVYVRRGMQARIKDGVDASLRMDDDSEFNVFNTSQYVPYYSDSQTGTSQDSRESEFMARGGEIRRDLYNETMRRTGYTRAAGNYTEH